MSKRAIVPWWAADEPQDMIPIKGKVKVNDEGADLHLGDARDADEPGGNGTGLFYCGRMLGEDAIPGSDGHCGPYGGPQCASCKRFQAYQESRHDVGSDLQNLFNLPGANTRLLQDRVKVKVQQIMAGSDLSDTTIRMLRGALEEKLGLQANSLQSTKRLRKWVFQVLEQEVLKKSQRSTKCERICRALADMETYPDNCRRMLIDALPSAMAHPEGLTNGGDPPHPHQVRMLETVQVALQESLDHVQVQSETTEIRLQTEQAKLTDLDEARQIAGKSAAEVRAEFEIQEKRLHGAQEACDNAKADVINAKKVQSCAVESRDSLEKERERHTAVHATFLQLLGDDIKVQELREQKLEEVREGLKAIGTEVSLVTAAITALTQVAGSRSMFEEISAKAVGKVFADYSERLERDLQRNAEESEDGPVESAEVIHDAMMNNAADKMLALATLRETLERRDNLFKAAKKEAKQQAQTLSSCRADRDTLQARSREQTEVLDIVRQLIISIDAPSPGATCRGASGASLLDEGPETQDPDGAEDTQGEATEAALSLGNELISAAAMAEDTTGEEAPGTGVSNCNSSQESTNPCEAVDMSVDPANLQGAFDLADDKHVREKAEELSAPHQVEEIGEAGAEPPAKRQKLENEAEQETEASVDIPSVMSSGGA